MLGRVVDAAILRIPGADTPPLADPSFAGMAQAIGEVIAQRFPGRPVVLLGVSIGAVIALAVRAPSLRRIVAVEPPLRTVGLWPIEGMVRRHLASRPDDRAAHGVFGELFGIAATGVRPRDYLPLLDRLDLPTDVILGAEPLSPRRELENLPSLVDEVARARLAAHPRVRLRSWSGISSSRPVAGPPPRRSTTCAVSTSR